MIFDDLRCLLVLKLTCNTSVTSVSRAWMLSSTVRIWSAGLHLSLGTVADLQIFQISHTTLKSEVWIFLALLSVGWFEVKLAWSHYFQHKAYQEIGFSCNFLLNHLLNEAAKQHLTRLCRAPSTRLGKCGPACPRANPFAGFNPL